MTLSGRARLGLVVAVVLIAGGWMARPWIDAVALIARAADLPGTLGTLAAWRAHATVTEPGFHLPTRHGDVAARIYRPEGAARRSVLLVPGVHRDGIDESRLVGLAEDLAASGYRVLTVATPDLQAFRITPASTDVIEDAARWLAADPGTSGPIGVLGISFSGGLSIVAAGRPDLRDHVAFVMSFGGHGDLPRVLRYLASGVAPDAPALPDAVPVAGVDHLSVRPPHDYGVAVTLLSLAGRGVVPDDQVEPLQDGIRLFLGASSLAVTDPPAGEREFARARAYAATLPEPAATLMAYVNDRAVEKLAPVLLPVAAELGDAPANAALSPERAPAPAAPVFLLHGADDNVIPSVETVLLAKHLHGRTEVHALLSGLITHAEVDRGAAATEVFRLARFWRTLMAQ